MTAAATYVYGAGRMGREVLAHCRATGREPVAFIDRAAVPGAVVDGVPVVAPEVAAAQAAEAEVLIALHSPGVDVAGIRKTLAGQPYERVTTLWDECERSRWLPRSPFWLDPHFDWLAQVDSIARARSLLVDARSRAIFDQQVALRRAGDYDAPDVPTPDDQYRPRGLAPWRRPMRLVDCGAYDGDTIRALRADGEVIERYIALEPDRWNFKQLRLRHGNDVGADLLQAGAYSRAGCLSFAEDGDGAAHVDANGATTIEVVAIDDLCADFHPTLIKMDIEGVERQALAGAKTTIARDRPELAISVYHQLDDLWEIPLQVAALDGDYRLWLRSHAWNGFDTVLYASAPR